MPDWTPDPEFVEFLDAIEARAEGNLPTEVWAAFMEVRTGTELGKMFYDRTMSDPRMRAIFESWKKLR